MLDLHPGFNWEANTIGSKCSDVACRVVVELKGEIEKIREQVQNINEEATC
ncbi:MAG: endoribonuclease YicC domain-containing protein [Evtepia gabavorous]